MGDVNDLGQQGRGTPLSAPSAIDSTHLLDGFDCGNAALNDWLKNKARKAESKSARTYVVCSGAQVVGYYCLSAGGVLRDDLPAKLRRNMPSSVPIMILGRLAVDALHQGRRIGSAMLLDAMKRTIGVSREVGVRAMLVHAIDDEATTFYLRYGFTQFPEGSKTLYLPSETMIEALRKAGT